MAESLTTKLRKHISSLESDFQIQHCSELSSSVHWTPSNALPVHRWFRYREGFSPYLFDSYKEAKHRLDPFCGCGTTLLESAKQGIKSYGIDLNPLATFVAKVKTRRYSFSDRDRFLSESKKILRDYNQVEPAKKPDYALLDKLFLPENLDALLRLKTLIFSVKNKKTQDLLFCSWLNILERCSNVFKEGNGLKYRNKKRNPGKYITVPDTEWIPKYFGASTRIFVENAWVTQYENIAADIINYQLKPGFTPKIRTGSCFEHEKLDFGQKFDLIVFSPPYANRFDYFEAFKMELWLGGFVKNKQDMSRLRSKSMRSNLAAKRFEGDHLWPELQPFLDAMDSSASSVRMGIKNALQGYFYDMRVLMRGLKPQLSEDGKIVIVVGNSAYAKSIIPSDALIAKLGKEEGYNINSIKVARHLHVSSQQRLFLKNCADSMRESIIELSLPQ